MLNKLEYRRDRFIKDLIWLAELKEKGVIGAKHDYKVTVRALLETKEEICKVKGGSISEHLKKLLKKTEDWL